MVDCVNGPMSKESFEIASSARRFGMHIFVIPNHVILNLFQDPVACGKSGMLKQVQDDRINSLEMTGVE